VIDSVRGNFGSVAFFGLLGFDTERVVGREVVDSFFFFFSLVACLGAKLCVAGGAVGRYCGCELGKFWWAIRAMRRRPGLEVLDPVEADSAPLEVIQAELMVQCWVTMAPLEVLQGHALLFEIATKT
jgi:hypothetical protein